MTKDESRFRPSSFVLRRSIGLIGCGRWGRNILRDLHTLGCAVTVVAPSDDSRRNAVEGGAAAMVDRIEALPAVDGIVVATPTATHAAVIEALLHRGIPIYCEKPLTPDRAAAARLAALAPDRLFVMDKWRYHPGIEALAAIARSGELGPVLGLRTTRVQWGNQHLDVDGIWVMAPHDLSIALEVLGALPAPRHAVGEVSDGVAVGLIGLLGDRPWVVLEVSNRAPVVRREVRLHCRDGIAVLDDGYADHIRVFRAADPHDTTAPEPERRPIATEWPLLRELRAFLEHLEGGPPPKSSAAEGAAIVATLAELRARAFEGTNDE
jgi:predicted dehydrogenase